MNTGGSSGSPLEFFIHKGITRPKERAFLNSFYYSIGYNRKQKIATFRGDPVPGSDIYMYDPIRKNFIFSSYRITKENIKKIVNSLNKIKPEFLFGYPSVVYDVSKIIKNNITLQLELSLKGIILASEKLFDFQIELIEDTFNTKVYSYYGHSERLVLAYKCSSCNNYIVDPMYGYAEIVDENNINITEKGKTGKIIGTGFHNLVMPLIRYDTNDESRYASKLCENCQKSNSIIFGDIEGRTSDYIMGYDGRRISITGIIFGQHLKEFNKISKFQLIQSEPGNIDFNIVAEDKLSNKEEAMLKKKIEIASDNTISVNIMYVDDIEKTPTGKFKYLKQNIN
jgi:phenylacetate-CoA ligase